MGKENGFDNKVLAIFYLWSIGMRCRKASKVLKRMDYRASIVISDYIDSLYGTVTKVF